jgi:hypothetical protein
LESKNSAINTSRNIRTGREGLPLCFGASASGYRQGYTLSSTK